MKKSNFKVIIFYSILILLVILASTSLFNMTAEDEPKYSEIVALFEEDKVESFTVSAEGELSLKTTDDEKIVFELQQIDYFREDIAEYVKANKKAEDGKGGNLEYYNYEPVETSPWWVSFLPYLVIIVLFVALWFYAMKQATGGKGGRINSFGKAKAKLGADEKKKRNMFLIGVTVIMAIVLSVLTYEVFVLHDRPLYIGGGGAPMDGKTGGLSLAEFGCFLTALPVIYLLVANFKKMTSTEKLLFILIILTFLVAFIITSLWGDNEINTFILGNIHGHSIWHILTALAIMEVVVWVDQRDINEKLRALGAKAM